jgi:hypothetical protein
MLHFVLNDAKNNHSLLCMEQRVNHNKSKVCLTGIAPSNPGSLVVLFMILTKMKVIKFHYVQYREKNKARAKAKANHLAIELIEKPNRK